MIFFVVWVLLCILTAALAESQGPIGGWLFLSRVHQSDRWTSGRCDGRVEARRDRAAASSRRRYEDMPILR